VIASLSHSVGSVFQPIFHAFGWLLAFFYGLIPNYAIAIVLLTIVIMGALTPFTIKSTKSMAAMQRLQPEIKKLQVKYKGAENRALLNEELMRLYKDEGANPIGGCLPVLLQAPFLFMLYSVIKGLANKVMVHGKLVSLPRYIPVHSKMYHTLVHSGGQIKAFGMDLNLKLFSIHSSFLAQIPFALFVLAAVGLQYFQMAQINNRNVKMGTKMPAQQLAMQRFLPLIFAFFYMAIPAAVVLYMIISTGIRIITQVLMYRAGLMDPHRGVEKKIHSGSDNEIEVVERPAIEAPKPTPAKAKAPQSQPTKRPAPKPSAYKPQPQSRSKAKRKRKAR
jgi:YidC/Oxa1 family membrane protein insertase